VDSEERQARLVSEGFKAARGMPTVPSFSLRDRWRADRPPEISCRSRAGFSFLHSVLGQSGPKPWLINCNKNKTFQGNTPIYLDISSLKCVAWKDFWNFFFFFFWAWYLGIEISFAISGYEQSYFTYFSQVVVQKISFMFVLQPICIILQLWVIL
jgi:hypothetical protein